MSETKSVSESAKGPGDAKANGPGRRRFTREFKEEAVRMMLDGHSAASVAERLGLSHANLLYRWKKDLVGQSGATGQKLDQRVRELEAELERTRRERDVLKKALCIFGRDG